MSNPVIGKKKAAILESGRELFWKYGFKRVSVEEICRRASVSKMTFYRYFADKAALARAVYDAEVEAGMSRFREILESDLPVPEKIRNVLLIKSGSVSNISREFLNDFYSDNETGLKSYIQEKIASSMEEILNDFRKAQERGVFRKDFKPEMLFYISQKIADSFNDPYLIGLYGSPAEVIMEVSELFTYGIAPKNSI
jgi:AcrR family transcriptional regulator